MINGDVRKSSSCSADVSYPAEEFKLHRNLSGLHNTLVYEEITKPVRGP